MTTPARVGNVLENKMRSDGITVPLTGNHDATFLQGLDATDIPGFDIYPQEFHATNPTRWNRVPMWLEGAHRSLPPDKPLFLSELQGGSFDPWAGPSYGACYVLTGADFENVFYKWVIAQGATMINLYMSCGGTSWGWLPYPGVYSSYDYGTAVDEARQLTEKFSRQKLIAAFIQAVPSLAKTRQIAPYRRMSSYHIDGQPSDCRQALPGTVRCLTCICRRRQMFRLG